ncbi:hypothetical protein [Streptomyces sp. NPDC050856]|uniref:hypothetical protein n=1 Tax=Streptomyces sp. NPDC050856 TaxID=3154939 RepID=UPI0033ECA2BB
MRHTRRAVGRRTAGSAAVAATVLALSACTAGHGDRIVGDDRYPYWQKEAGAPEAAAFMKVRVPPGATEVKGAVRVQPGERVYLLSFLTDQKTAKSVADDLRPEHPLEAQGLSSSLSGDGFQHLGLTPPQQLEGVRSTSACPPCAGDARRSHVQAVEMHVGDGMGDRVRVYLAAY